jgi:hypothetical protein
MAAQEAFESIKGSENAAEVIYLISKFAGKSLSSPSTHAFDDLVKVRILNIIIVILYCFEINLPKSLNLFLKWKISD